MATRVLCPVHVFDSIKNENLYISLQSSALTTSSDLVLRIRVQKQQQSISLSIKHGYYDDAKNFLSLQHIYQQCYTLT